LPVFSDSWVSKPLDDGVVNNLAEMLFEEQEDGQFTRQESSTTLQDSTDSVPNPVKQPKNVDYLKRNFVPQLSANYMGNHTREGELCVYDMRQRLNSKLANVKPLLKTSFTLGMMAIVNDEDDSLIVVGKGELTIWDIQTNDKKHYSTYTPANRSIVSGPVIHQPTIYSAFITRKQDLVFKDS